MTAESQVGGHEMSAIVVDSAPDRRTRTCVLLRAAGFHVVEADHACDAAPLARGRDLAVILVDPPDLQGVELIARLRSEHETAAVSILARSPAPPGVGGAPPPA
ncbi:MAG: hypothetical protein ACRDMJ_17585, partial [Solirubrobacteraceae bacterium]